MQELGYALVRRKQFVIIDGLYNIGAILGACYSYYIRFLV